MPKTLLEKIVFTVVMAAIMVYGMIVYNVALATGGVTNATFGMALHEMPIMVPVAFVLEFFVVEKLAALGYAAVFGSATNTLMAPIMLGIEVFGGNNMLAFVVVCSLAYVVNGNRSIYGAQENIEKIISR